LMFNEDELISISALNHFYYCPRRCALIHIEQIWTENLFTAEGRIMHEHVHDAGDELRGNVRIARGVPLRSLKLGLVGVSDVVEFHKISSDTWQPFPVEYKLGKPKLDHSDMIQLCAQAICLEEMLSIGIPDGALFYGRTRRRSDVVFDEALRHETAETVEKARVLINAGVTPPPIYAKRCEKCSLINDCLPKKLEKKVVVNQYFARMTSEDNP
jgi:CRISPR-associated exonuclease Cas4